MFVEGGYLPEVERVRRFTNVFAVMRMLAFVVVAVLALSFNASAAPTLPDVGVDVAEYIEVLATTLGAVVGTALAAAISFWIVRQSWGAVRKMIRV